MISVSLRNLPDSKDLDHVDRSKTRSPTSRHDTDSGLRESLTFAANDQDWRLGSGSLGRNTNMAGQQNRHPFGYNFFGNQQTQTQNAEEVPEPGANPLLNPREDGYLAQFYNAHPQSH